MLKNSKAKYWMTPLYHHPILGKYYVRFYGPKTPYDRKIPWGWYQANLVVCTYEQALAAFQAWAVKTELYIRRNPDNEYD